LLDPLDRWDPVVLPALLVCLDLKGTPVPPDPLVTMDNKDLPANKERLVLLVRTVKTEPLVPMDPLVRLVSLDPKALVDSPDPPVFPELRDIADTLE